MEESPTDRLMTVEEAAKFSERIADVFEGFTKGEYGMVRMSREMRKLSQDLREGNL